MISGLNQEVELLGKSFHFQTEVTGQDARTVRTEVFVGGKVVATREVRLEMADADGEEALRGRIKEHHSKTIKTFLLRAQRYQLRVPDTDPGVRPAAVDPPEPATATPETTTTGEQTPGDMTSDVGTPEAPPVAAPSPSGAIADAIRVRRFFGRFRELIGPATSLPDNLPERLEKADEAFVWMIGSPLFQEIRIDEQARCSLLRSQIDEWLASDRDYVQAAQIWSGIITFSNYLSEVNLRSELMSFDQQLLVWGLAEVQAHGMSDEVLKRLESIYGRHPRLDRILDEPDGVTDLTWTAHLRSVLTLL